MHTNWLQTSRSLFLSIALHIVLGGIFRNQNEKFVKKYSDKVPLGRMGQENDIKGLIAYLSSNLSNYMTGQNIILDGGLTCTI